MMINTYSKAHTSNTNVKKQLNRLFIHCDNQSTMNVEHFIYNFIITQEMMTTRDDALLKMQQNIVKQYKNREFIVFFLMGCYII